MTINARDIISDWLCHRRGAGGPDHIDRTDAYRCIAALMAAAGVEPGGRLVIEHADGWPLGRLERETSHFIVTVDTTAGDRIYRVVAP